MANSLASCEPSEPPLPQSRAAWTFVPYSSDAAQSPRPCGVRSSMFQIGLYSSMPRCWMSSASLGWTQRRIKDLLVGFSRINSFLSFRLVARRRQRSTLTPTHERVVIHSRHLITNQLPSTGLYSSFRGGVRAAYDSSVYVFVETGDLAILDRPNVCPC